MHYTVPFNQLLETKADITKDPEKLAVADDNEQLSLLAKKKSKV